MIKSMTGFGQATTTRDNWNLVIEIRSLNSKFFDLSLRSPRILADKEIEIRNLLADKLERGKISFSIDLQQTSTEIKQSYNESLFLAYYSELKKLADKSMAGYEGLFELALHSPDVIEGEKNTTLPADFWEFILKHINDAVSQCDKFRATEGKALEVKLVSYVNNIAESLIQVEQLDPKRVEKIRSKLKGSVTDFFGSEGFDMNRLEQEIIFYIEKLDIHEERVRLKTHLDYFLKLLTENQSNGKKLGFLAQEIGREINTIGSKANDAGIQKHVVMMKDELEKIKEQLNNIL
jgi:uncharacterized protein (TIGR00255 family)